MITHDNAAALVPVEEATRGWISQLDWSPDGRILVCSSAGGVSLWRGSLTSKGMFIKGHEGPVKGIAFAPNGATLATASADTTVKVWDLRAFSAKMEPVTIYRDFHDAVEKVAFLRNGNLVAGGVDGTVRVFTPGKTQVLRGHGDEVTSVNTQGTIIISGSRDKTIRLWDALTGHTVAVLAGHTDWVRRTTVHPTKPLLLSTSRDRTACLWDISEPSNPVLRHTLAHDGDVRAAALDVTGDIAATGSTDATIKLWHVETGNLLTTLDGHKMPVVALTFHPKNTVLASGGGDNRVMLWGLEGR